MRYVLASSNERGYKSRAAVAAFAPGPCSPLPRPEHHGSGGLIRKTRYAQVGDIDIAYQVLGDGPIDVLLWTGFLMAQGVGQVTFCPCSGDHRRVRLAS